MAVKQRDSEIESLICYIDSFRFYSAAFQTCLLDILDTAGQEEYSVMRDNYMRLADGLLLVYSVTDPQTFEEATKIYNFSCQVKGVDTVPAVRVHSHRSKSNAKEKFFFDLFCS